MAAEAGPIEVFFPGDITFDSNRPVGGGGYGDLFKGEHASKGSLALKRLRVCITPEDDPKAVKRARNARIVEAALWRKLLHPNVLTCVGLFHNSWDEVYLVSPWVDNGSLVNFVVCNPEADRTQLLCDVAEGLAYLHENDIIHGDVKGVNALVTKDRRVALCDFGLSKLASSVNTSTGAVGTLRWQSPELLMGGPRTKQTDVYGFAITIYEILSGCVPFGQYEQGAVVVAVLVRDERPPKEPQHSLNGEVYAGQWQLAETCWAKATEGRPTMTQVVARWPSSGLRPVLSKPAGAEERPTVIENSPSDLAKAKRLHKRAQAFHSRYTEYLDAADLEAAIRFYREGLALNLPGHSRRLKVLYNLGLALDDRYDLQFDSSDLDEAIALCRERVDLSSPGDHERLVSCRRLSNLLEKRHQLLKDASDIEEPIILLREEVQFHPPGGSERPWLLDALAGLIKKRYKLTHNASDLEEVITIARDAVQCSPPEDSGHMLRLSNLAYWLYQRHTLSLNASDLEEAITFSRESVQKLSRRDPVGGVVLNNLGLFLETRYKLEKRVADLEALIDASHKFFTIYGAEHSLWPVVGQRLMQFLKLRPPTPTFKSKLTSKLKALKF